MILALPKVLILILYFFIIYKPVKKSKISDAKRRKIRKIRCKKETGRQAVRRTVPIFMKIGRGYISRLVKASHAVHPNTIRWHRITATAKPKDCPAYSSVPAYSAGKSRLAKSRYLPKSTPRLRRIDSRSVPEK